jgi:ubiquinone/menaquinone biosynthesis C-methylase UbiE
MRRPTLVFLLVSAFVFGCTAWKRCAYERGGRDDWQQPDQVIAALGIAPGDRVADLGSGSGYFTVRLARAVGPTGKVWAVDVDEDMNAYLRKRLDEEGIENVEVVLATFDDPLLPDGEVDLLFTSDTYHHVQERPAYFRRLHADLAPGGRVAVLEFDGRKGWFVRLMKHYTEKDLLLREMQEAGYRADQDLDFLDRQSFVVFAPE